MTPLNRCPICGRQWLEGSPLACDHTWQEWETHRKREVEPERPLPSPPEPGAR